MKIVVLLRRRRERPDAGVSGTGEALLGRCEAAALATAIAIGGAAGGKAKSITVIAAGPPEREDDVLRHALAAGADRAVRVWDPALAEVDYLGIARVLAAATKKAGFDLILAGDRSEDEAQGAVGPAVAELASVPHVTAALGVEVEGNVARVTRRDPGLVRTVRMPLPGLVTVASGTGTGTGTGSAKNEIEVMDLAALGITAQELKHRDRCIGRAHPVRVARNATIVRGAGELLARLRDERLLE